MPKITSIKQQVRQAGRYSIYVDGEYSFSLSENALIQSGVVSGQALTNSEVADYKILSVDDKVYNRALRYVAMRQRTTWELRTYMLRKEASEQLINQTIDRLTELGLLNDAQYAISFVRDRQLLRPTSKRKLQLELKQKHISDQAISLALEDNEFDETISLQQIIIKKRRQSKYQDDQKLMQYLARQGYGYSEIKSAMHTSSDEDY